MNIRDSTEFVGAKVVLMCGDDLVAYLRDDFAHIPDPNLWDFPGGECQDGETALDCAIRETYEEFGVCFTEEELLYEASYQSHQPGRADVAFFVAKVESETIEKIRFGDEGQCWSMMPVSEFLSHANAVRELQVTLQTYLKK